MPVRTGAARSGGRGRVAAGSLVVAPFVIPPATFDVAHVSIGDRFADAGTVLAAYARLLVWPAGLHLDRLTPVWRGWIPLGVAFALGTLMLMARFLAGRALRGSAWSPCWPVTYRSAASSRYPRSRPLGIHAEHGLYMTPGSRRAAVRLRCRCPLRGVARMCRDAWRAWPLATLAIVPLAAAAWTGPVLARQRVLASEETAYRSTLAHSPRRVRFNLGVLLLDARRDAEAADLYEDCIAISPNDAGMRSARRRLSAARGSQQG
jgi:hypothetical protein